MRQLLTIVAIGLSLTLASTVLADEHGWHGGGGHDWHGGGGHDWHGGGWQQPQPHYGDFLGGMIGGALGSIFFPPPVPIVVAPQYQVPEIVPGTPGWYSYCANKYRSFDATTSTYLGFDGVRHPCM